MSRQPEPNDTAKVHLYDGMSDGAFLGFATVQSVAETLSDDEWVVNVVWNKGNTYEGEADQVFVRSRHIINAT